MRRSAADANAQFDIWTQNNCVSLSFVDVWAPWASRPRFKHWHGGAFEIDHPTDEGKTPPFHLFSLEKIKDFLFPTVSLSHFSWKWIVLGWMNREVWHMCSQQPIRRLWLLIARQAPRLWTPYLTAPRLHPPCSQSPLKRRTAGRCLHPQREHVTADRFCRGRSSRECFLSLFWRWSCGLLSSFQCF